MEYKVKKLTTKQNVFLTGVGQLGVQFEGSVKSVEMVTCERGVTITKGTLNCLVPWGNIVCADGLEPIADAKKAK